MNKNIQSFVYQINVNIPAGNITVANSPSIGAIQGKFQIISAVFSCSGLDSVTGGYVNILTKISLRTFNTSSYYSSMFPGGTVSYISTLDFIFSEAFTANTFFIIQPGDNLRFVTNFYLQTAATNIVICNAVVVLNGHAID